MPSIVAIDIETTGLDASTDAIIEIGAVRFSGHRVESEWSTLVNPNRPIPYMITQLTGINNDMVRNAPALRTVLPGLVEFAGHSPVLGHNVRFDLSFLQRQGVLAVNESIDTYDLASILLPTASRYNLGALGHALGILLPATHRALDDARVTHAVYATLYDRAVALPIDLLAEFVRLSESFDWGASWILGQILRDRVRQPVQARRVHEEGIDAGLGAALKRKRPSGAGPDQDSLFQKARPVDLAPLQPVSDPEPLDPDEMAALLEHGGPFSRYFDEYEHRPQQVQMLQAVSKAFSESKHLLVEAGTGTGKSFAYLVPAAHWALKNNTRVVISTNTINLQDQLIKKDLPDLCSALNLDLRMSVLKGRSNYLCPRRLDLMRQRGPENADEMRVLAKVLIWLQESQTGDRSEINLNGPAEREVWNRLCSEDEGCKIDVCLKRTGGNCPFYRARMAAQSAHLLVVNHALLLADSASGSRVLPEFQYLVIDEGHHLESATTDALSFRLMAGDLERMLRELGGASSGLLGRYLNLTRDLLRPSEAAAVNQLVQRSTDISFRLETISQRLFHAVEQFLADEREGRPMSMYAQQVRILPSTRTLPSWSEVELTWDDADLALKGLMEQVYKLYQTLVELGQDLSEELEDLQNSISNLYRRLAEIEMNISALVCKPEPDRVYWVEMQPNGNRLAFNAAPLHIGSLMEKFLWHEKSSVVLTSATLTAGGEFDYLRSRLNADEADELTLGSPFDFENAAMLYLVNDIPEPNDLNGYQRAVDACLVRLSKATGGRLLALFTNYAQLKRTSQIISPILTEDGIQVYEQGDGASANTLLETFREAEKAVLLGTRSFWEGVDVPGSALSVLVIVKLPFDVPTEPIVAARSETFDDPFNEYNLPEAILRFRQGFGRLIRTQTDRGVVVVLDRRILTKRYGRAFLESLPTCHVKVGSMSDLPRTASQWVGT
jgi:DNA polymerase-3 subunit epsilon/ATP-dependent DNA helicase DinG